MTTQKKFLLSIGVFILTALLTVGLLQAAPLFAPPNDNVTSPIFVSTVPFTATNVDMATATLETDEKGCTGDINFTETGSVWYKYSIPFDTAGGTLTATATGGDATIGLYTVNAIDVVGQPIHPLNEVNCTDVLVGGTETLSVAVTAGTTYYIRAGTFDGTLATVTINFATPPKLEVADPKPGAFGPLANNSTLNVAMTVGAPWVQEFSIQNKGYNTNLTLSNLTASGAGVSIKQVFDKPSLPGQPQFSTAKFTVQVNPTTAGPINGSVQFTTNDPNATNFVINFTGVAQAMPTAPTGTRQVSTTGTDSGDCQAAPCKTIPYALGQATHGNLITIASGTYTNPLVITKTVTLQGAGSTSTIINGTKEFGGGSAIKIATGNKVAISGLTITGGSGSTPEGAGNGAVGAGVFNAGNSSLDDVIITNNKAPDQ